jgi:DHA2 family methylenomycin A resistance protein-like MFS transporter
MSTSNPVNQVGTQRRLWAAYLSGAFGLAISAQGNFLVPLRARELGAGFDTIGLIIGAGALAPALFSIASGAVIDRIGPRRTFILGAAATVVVSLLFVFVTNYWWFLVLQPLAGVARNVAWVASQGYITSIGPASQRPALTGRFSFFSNVSTMVAPLLCGTAAQFVGFRWALLVPAVYAAVFLLIGWLLIEPRAERETPRVAQGTGLRAAVRLCALRGIQIALLLSFTRLWITLVHSSFMPLFLVDKGFDPGTVGLVSATSGFVAAALAPTVGFWTRRASPEAVTGASLACGALGVLLIPHLASMPFVFLPSALVGVGGGLSLPLLLGLVANAAPPGRRGVALGLRGMVNQTASSAAPVLVGPIIASVGIVAGFSTGGLAAAAMLLGTWMLHGSERRAGSRI